MDRLAEPPLYKAYRGSDKVSKHAEEAAEEAAQALDELRVRHEWDAAYRLVSVVAVGGVRGRVEA